MAMKVEQSKTKAKGGETRNHFHWSEKFSSVKFYVAVFLFRISFEPMEATKLEV